MCSSDNFSCPMVHDFVNIATATTLTSRILRSTCEPAFYARTMLICGYVYYSAKFIAYNCGACLTGYVVTAAARLVYGA